MASIHQEIEIERSREAVEAAQQVGPMIQHGLNTMKKTLEAS